MATRYSGNLKLDIRLGNDSETYSVRLYDIDNGALLHSLTGLRRSPHEQARIAADSAEAYDSVARSAVGFAGYEQESIYSFCDCDESGEAIVRRRAAQRSADSLLTALQLTAAG